MYQNYPVAWWSKAMITMETAVSVNMVVMKHFETSMEVITETKGHRHKMELVFNAEQ